MAKDYDIKIDEDLKTKVDDDIHEYSETIKHHISAEMDELFMTTIWESTGYCEKYKIASKEELTRFFENALKVNSKIDELNFHIDRVLEETESMTSISAEQRLRNEMRYIKEELEKLKDEW